MNPVSFVGVDPASGDFQCALTRQGERHIVFRTFSVAESQLHQMVDWIRNEHIDIVAIEGQGGYATPLEKTLRGASIPFYSFSPFKIAKYRQAVLGQHKNNLKDATTVAFYARQLAAQDDLEPYRRTWFPDEVLRPLVRMYEQKQKEATREINRLWQTIHGISGDLYLFLKGSAPGTHNKRSLSQQWMLKLFAWYPDVHTWQSFTPDGITTVLKEHRAGIIEKVMCLKDMVSCVSWYSDIEKLRLQVSATTALALKQVVRSLYHQIEAEAAKNPATQRLMCYGGIGALTAAQIVGEIADISRFPNNNHLASYAGLGRREHKTGTGNTERRNHLFNRRLKNTFFTAARNYTLFNPDSHLTGYYRSLRSRGMKPTEVYKRVARALVRRFYRDLTIIREQEEKETRREGNSEPSPTGNKPPEQPHTSPSEEKFTTSRAQTKPLMCESIVSKQEVYINKFT